MLLHSVCSLCRFAFPYGLCRQWLVTLRPVTSAKSQVMHLGMLMTALCGGCLVRIVDSGLRRCIQSQVRSSSPSLVACSTRHGSFITSSSSSSSERSRQSRDSLLELNRVVLVTRRAVIAVLVLRMRRPPGSTLSPFSPLVQSQVLSRR